MKLTQINTLLQSRIIQSFQKEMNRAKLQSMLLGKVLLLPNSEIGKLQFCDLSFVREFTFFNF